MRLSVRPLLIAAALIWFAPPADAAVITWHFEGKVMEGSTGSSFAVGDTVFGEFSFEATTPASGATATRALYTGAVQSFSITGLDSLMATDPGVTVNFIEIWDGHSSSPTVDRFWAQLHDTVNPQRLFEINLQRGLAAANPACIANVALPLAPYDLGCFNTATVAYNSLGGAVTVKVRLRLDDVSVPEPVVLLLLGVGLAGAWAGRRRHV